MFDEQIIKAFMDRYGNIEDIEKIKQAMRQDGLGDLLDMIDEQDYNAFLEEHGTEIKKSLMNYTGSGVMPKGADFKCIPLNENDTFNFDPQKCLTSCKGRCCKQRNYLMISYSDIFRILSSQAAHHLNIHSTRQLFESDPPVVEAFLSEEYNLYLSYIRFLPIDAEPGTRPEDAQDNICPFLYPIEEVYSFHKLKLVEGASKDAMGCILINNKPAICRLSPVGQTRGLETGIVSYEYARPAKVCPGCKTDVEIPLKSYIRSLLSFAEKKESAFFHKIIMAHYEREKNGYDQKRFNSILLEFYNIDRLLSIYGQTPERRPRYRQLVEILLAASEGDFSLYDRFIENLVDNTQEIK